MSALNLGLGIVGALILILGLTAGLIHARIPLLSEPMLAVGLGILIGPVGFDVLGFADGNVPLEVVEQTARIAIGIAVMAAALRLPHRWIERAARSFTVVLLAGMVAMFAVSGVLTTIMLPVSVSTGFLIAAALTPTDPVIAGTIVTGPTARQYIPHDVRHLMSAESGANDGLAYAFAFLPLLAATTAATDWSQRWLVGIVLVDIVAAVAIGAAVGWLAGKAQVWSARRYYTEVPLLTVTIGMSLAVLGAVRLIGSDGILGVFAAGLAFNWICSLPEEEQQAEIQETIDRVVSLPMFLLFGIAIPWGQWATLPRGVPVLVVLILVLRRLPAILVLRPAIPVLERRRDALFLGWFGPIGIAAVYYATLLTRRTGQPQIWAIVSLAVTASVFAHGATSTPLTKRFHPTYVRDD